MANTRLERFEQELQSRRSFLQTFLAKLLGFTFVGSCISALVYLFPARVRSAADSVLLGADGNPVSAAQIPPGTGVVGWLGRRPAIVINREGQLEAFNAVCTHLGCVVSWDPGRSLILCPCHGGVFAPDGRVLSGPPGRPLRRLSLVVDNGTITAPAGTAAG